MTVFLAGAAVSSMGALAQGQAAGEAKALRLDVADDGKQIKLLVRHPEIGLVCELHCYEGGPFQYGKGDRCADGSVRFVHTSGRMTATTTFTPQGEDRVAMDVVVEGPLEEQKKVNLIGPCMQLWHSEAFQRRESLAEFVGRCFLYTVRGPVGMLDTALGRMKSFPVDAPENNPPCTQWYLPIDAAHPGDIWGFGASGDRPVEGVVGVASRDGKWLAAIGCARTLTLGQGWHDCIHHVPHMQSYLDEGAGRIVHRSMLYVMPNDRRRLLESFRRDCPAEREQPALLVSVAASGALRVQAPAGKASALDLALELGGGDAQREKSRGPSWKASPWGGFVRAGSAGTLWAYPNGETLEIWASVKKGTDSARVQAALRGKGWTPVRGSGETPGLVQRSSDGAGIAAWLWEESEPGQPSVGVLLAGAGPANGLQLRGRLYVGSGDLEALRARWSQTREEWAHAHPYRMPVETPVQTSGPARGVRFAPSAVEGMAYGLTILPPWKDGGTLHVNFPEHLEHGDVGYGILRYSDAKPDRWQVAPDGRSASYEVESPELPGVIIRASAVAERDRARLTLKITNGGPKTLERVKPLLCFWYAGLTGFPARLTDNFQHTYTLLDGEPTALGGILTRYQEATAKVAYVRGCDQHDCDKFALSRGGLIERDVDLAWVTVTARDGKRKLILTFTPGKSILSNAYIPCAHADPFFGTIAPGQSAEATGVLQFTEASLEKETAKLRRAAALGR